MTHPEPATIPNRHQYSKKGSNREKMESVLRPNAINIVLGLKPNPIKSLKKLKLSQREVTIEMLKSTDVAVAWILRIWVTAGITISVSLLWNVTQQMQIHETQIRNNADQIKILIKETMERNREYDKKNPPKQN